MWAAACLILVLDTPQVTLATAPCGTSLVSMNSAPDTKNMLQFCAFDSLMEVSRGSIVVTPSTLKT